MPLSILQKLKFWKKDEPRPIKLVFREASKVRLAEWKQDRDLVKSARVVLEDQRFRHLFDVLMTEHPAKIMLFSPTSVEDRAVMQARIEGYQLCLNNLESLGIYEQAKQPLEPTFEQDDD